jgi:hypothetical protein
LLFDAGILTIFQNKEPRMNVAIGELAGKVWAALRDGEAMTPAQLAKATGDNEKVVCIAIGWLAREDKLEINKLKASLKVALKASELR